MQEEAEEKVYHLVIVGAGRAALHLVARLPPAILAVRPRQLGKKLAQCCSCCLQRLMRQPAPKLRFDLDRGACWLLKRRLACRAQATRVVDERGEWLAAWRARHARCGSAHLRSPVTQCVHAAPGALAAYCAQHGREQVRPALARAVVGVHSKVEYFNVLCELRNMRRKLAARQ